MAIEPKLFNSCPRLSRTGRHLTGSNDAISGLLTVDWRNPSVELSVAFMALAWATAVVLSWVNASLCERSKLRRPVTDNTARRQMAVNPKAAAR
jgi:hypothetical protein